VINKNSFVDDDNKDNEDKKNENNKDNKNEDDNLGGNKKKFERKDLKHKTILSGSFNATLLSNIFGGYNANGFKKNLSNNNIVALNKSLNESIENTININNTFSEKININDSINLELVESNIIKLSITKLLLHSLNLSGFNFYIPFPELKILNKIGEGGFGEVYLGLWNFKKVAIKKFTIDYNKIKNNAKLFYRHKNHNLTLKSIIYKFIKEINIISNLRHPNILLYIGASIDQENNFYIVTEYIPNGNLFDYLHKNNEDYEDVKNNSKLNKKLKIKIAYQIALSIKYLHSRNITHCDIKSSNILLDYDFNIKLSDYGLSQFLNILDFSEKKRGKFGTTHWMPPEIMLNNKYQEKSDVFSYGMILYELISGKIPYKGLSNVQIVGLVADAKRIVDISGIKTDFFLKKLCSQCIMYDIDKRPTFEEIINYFEKISEYLNKKDIDLEEFENYI
jgi:tRNA A-37 threonylcarbamoyl transferase component Bud32